MKAKNNDWSKQHEKLYSMLYNYMNKNFKNINEYSFINENKRQLMSIIEKILIGVHHQKKVYFL